MAVHPRKRAREYTDESIDGSLEESEQRMKRVRHSHAGDSSGDPSDDEESPRIEEQFSNLSGHTRPIKPLLRTARASDCSGDASDDHESPRVEEQSPQMGGSTPPINPLPSRVASHSPEAQPSYRFSLFTVSIKAHQSILH